MSATTYARYQATHHARFRRLLSAWLATLPPDGWTGGVVDLFAALDAFERAGKFFAFIPTGSALTKTIQHHETTIRAAGCALRIGRTKSGRFLSLEAVPKANSEPDDRAAHAVTIRPRCFDSPVTFRGRSVTLGTFRGVPMSTLDALLSGIVGDPLEETRWLVLADWLEEHDADPRRSELLRLHRKLLATCCEPDAHRERAEWQRRVVELLGAGVRPCVPQHRLTLPGGVPLVGSFVPPGSFLMGGTEYDDEKPVHRRTLTAGFFLGMYPVTQAQWNAVMGTEPSHFKGPNRPVEQVSWDDGQAFCAKLTAHAGGSATVRLPTEAEWECACRAGTTTEYHFGDVLNTDLANYDGTGTWNGSPEGLYRQETTDAGMFPPNPWGLYDMHGNVWEWCADPYLPYSVEEQSDNNENSNDNTRVLRGGSWSDSPQGCRAAYRLRGAPAYRNNYIGFRVCFRLD